ncbi:MAG: sodium-translocating pyrophosphatase [Nanoarchaeota archaeon]
MVNLIFVYITLALSVFFVYFFNRRMMKEETGTEKMKEIAALIQRGAKKFLLTEYIAIGVFVVIVSTVLFFLLGKVSAISFVVGSVSSGLAGLFGMNRAVKANVRTANAARRSLNEALKISFSTGSSIGIGLVVIGVVGLLCITTIFDNDVNALLGYSFGVAAIALFARVGGGIFTKAADIGADIVGKMEAGIPEDDPRNPAVIADNVGDNVGDVAGMGADLFDSLIVNLVAAMAIGMVPAGISKISQVNATSAFYYPVFVVCAGLIASIIGTFFCKTKSNNPSKALGKAFIITCIVMVTIAFLMNSFFFKDLNVVWTVVIGVLAGISLGKVTEYYTSYDYKHVKAIAEDSRIGAAGNILHGLSVGKRSTLGVILVLMTAIFLSNNIAGLYGIAMAGISMLALAAIVMAIDVYGPIVDNAGGIVEMSGLPAKIRKRTDSLDAAGNTTAAIGKGFAIGSAALAASALLYLFAGEAGLVERGINILTPKVLIGLFIGGLLPYVFSAYILLAVSNAATKIAEEVRRQFKTIKGIMTGNSSPDYDRCIVIATKSALKEMVVPSLVVVFTPIVVGFLLGPEALGASLAGTLVTGILLGVKQSNSGGAWDNAKKHVENGHFGGKGSAAHRATIVGDTVGDPNKDSSGPSLNIVIKLTILVATVFVTFF